VATVKLSASIVTIN